MRVHHVLECTNVTCVEVTYTDIKPTYLFEIWAYIRVKCNLMPQACLLFFQNWRLLWHGVQKQNDESIKMACSDKSGVRDLLIFTVPFPQLRGQSLGSSCRCKIEIWEVIYYVWVLLAQVFECCPAPSSCRGHKSWVNSPIPMSIGVIAPRKKTLLQKCGSPLGL